MRTLTGHSIKNFQNCLKLDSYYLINFCQEIVLLCSFCTSCNFYSRFSSNILYYKIKAQKSCNNSPVVDIRHGGLISGLQKVCSISQPKLFAKQNFIRCLSKILQKLTHLIWEGVAVDIKGKLIEETECLVVDLWQQCES